MSLGGFFGSICAAFLTQRYEPRYCFMFSSVMGLVMAFVASRLNINLENDGRSHEDSKMGFWANLKRNIREIGEAFKVR